MKPEQRLAGSDSRYCLYGARYISDLLRAFCAEETGVRKAEDREHIHRMRVASRRIRATLPLFRDCFRKKDYRRWMREIRAVTRALGAARDADVQIEFLETSAESVTGLLSLLSHLQEKRAALQPGVVAALDRLNGGQVVGEMEEELARITRSGAQAGTPAAYRQAFTHMSSSLCEVFSFEPFVAMPDRIEEHHAMRIAVKRLRYTMEAFSDLYEGSLNRSIREVKDLQEILGGMHDCDVWLQLLPGFSPATPGILQLIKDQKKRRQELHSLLVERWEEQKAKGVWDDLLEAISPPSQGTAAGVDTIKTDTDVGVMVTRMQENRTGDRRVLVESCAGRYGGDLLHARQVCSLSLRLFDELQPLHRGGETDCDYLAYAALLHDIGWTKGRAGHHRRSLALIRSDERLPFDARERLIVGNIARYHRKSLPKKSHAPFAALDAPDRELVCELAALLRVADGLDVTHAGAVREIRCGIHPDRVVIGCTISAPIDEERESAAKKSNLFESVFGRIVVIE